MISMVDPIAINVERPIIDIGYNLDKEFIELISMNPSMILNLVINQIDSYHICVRSFFT